MFKLNCINYRCKTTVCCCSQFLTLILAGSSRERMLWRSGAVRCNMFWAASLNETWLQHKCVPHTLMWSHYVYTLVRWGLFAVCVRLKKIWILIKEIKWLLGWKSTDQTEQYLVVLDDFADLIIAVGHFQQGGEVWGEREAHEAQWWPFKLRAEPPIHIQINTHAGLFL